MRVIIILLIIIVLILVAPTVLAFISMFLMYIVGELLSMWWLFLIIIAALIIIPIICSLCRNSKDSNIFNKKYIFSASFALVFLCIGFGLYGKYKYPLIFEYQVDDWDRRSKLEARFLRNRDTSIIADTVPIGHLRFGMPRNEVLEQVRKEGISNEIFFDDYTFSKVTMFGSEYSVFITYEFDSLNLLHSVSMLFDNKDILSIWDKIKGQYGKKYFEENYGTHKTLTWLNGNQRIILGRGVTSNGKKYHINYSNDNYTGDLFSDSNNFHDPIQESINRELSKTSTDNFTNPFFLDFQFGMSEKEVAKKANKLITGRTKSSYDAKEKLLKLDRFHWQINNNDSISINTIQFVFFKSKLYEIKIYTPLTEDELSSERVEMGNIKRTRLLSLLIEKYGEYNYRRYENHYVWIKQDMRIDLDDIYLTFTNTQLLDKVKKNEDTQDQTN